MPARITNGTFETSCEPATEKIEKTIAWRGAPSPTSGAIASCMHAAMPARPKMASAAATDRL